MKKLLIMFCLTALPVFAEKIPDMCPNCGSRNTILPVVYGDPSPEMIKLEKAGKIICGGRWALSEKNACSECNFLYSPGKTPLPALLIVILGKEFQSFDSVPLDTERHIIGGKVYEKITELTIRKVKNAVLMPPDPIFSSPIDLIMVTLHPGDAEKWQQLTADHTGKKAAVYLKGHYMCTPLIMEKMTGDSFQISGTFKFPQPSKAVKWLNFQTQQ